MNKVRFNWSTSPYSPEGVTFYNYETINFTELMFQRYHNKIKELPSMDQTDIILYPLGKSLQGAPDYA